MLVRALCRAGSLATAPLRRARPDRCLLRLRQDFITWLGGEGRGGGGGWGWSGGEGRGEGMERGREGGGGEGRGGGGGGGGEEVGGERDRGKGERRGEQGDGKECILTFASPLSVVGVVKIDQPDHVQVMPD